MDFDSTLYDTSRFTAELWKIIALEAHLPVGQVRSDSESYYFHEHLRGYEYEKHIKSYNLDTDKMWQKLDIITTREDYLYLDSADCIQTLRTNGYAPKILTFGEERFQLAKIRPMLPYLVGDTEPANMNITVVDRKKNQHIFELHEGEKGVLIDDKPDQDLPQGFTEIHINRSRTTDEPITQGNIVMVSNLAQAVKVIRQLTD